MTGTGYQPLDDRRCACGKFGYHDPVFDVWRCDSCAREWDNGPNAEQCLCGHARCDHFPGSGECRSYFVASDGRAYPCECNEFAPPPPFSALPKDGK